MKKGLLSLIGAGIITVAGLAGCGGNKNAEGQKDTKATVITTDTTGRKIIEKFNDFGNDGDVDHYIVGPALRDPGFIDNTMPSHTDSTIKAYVGLSEFIRFRNAYPDTNLKPAIRYGSENGGVLILDGVIADVMDSTMQRKVNEKYQTLIHPISPEVQ